MEQAESKYLYYKLAARHLPFSTGSLAVAGTFCDVSVLAISAQHAIFSAGNIKMAAYFMAADERNPDEISRKILEAK